MSERCHGEPKPRDTFAVCSSDANQLRGFTRWDKYGWMATGRARMRGRGPAGRHELLLGLRPSMVVGGAAVLGGLAWLLLVPAAELERRNLLSYDTYNRLLAAPLLLFAIALYSAPRALAAQGRLVRLGFSVAAMAAGLLLAGNLVEFYGVVLQDGLNAYAARQGGRARHWIGSDVGWITFGVGMLVFMVGGVIIALALHRSQTRPRWLIVFAATLGIGVLAGNLFVRESAFISVPVLAVYATGWISFGLLVGAGTVATSASTSRSRNT